jgi:predicted nuclease of predicted toxin-antitoxin system
MRFLVDAMFPREFAIVLRELGFEARHVRGIKLGAATDSAIWQLACSGGETLISKDKDFIELAKSDNRARLVLYRLPNENYAKQINTFKQKISEIISKIESGERLIEIS